MSTLGHLDMFTAPILSSRRWLFNLLFVSILFYSSLLYAMRRMSKFTVMLMLICKLWWLRSIQSAPDELWISKNTDTGYRTHKMWNDVNKIGGELTFKRCRRTIYSDFFSDFIRHDKTWFHWHSTFVCSAIKNCLACAETNLFQIKKSK